MRNGVAPDWLVRPMRMAVPPRLKCATDRNVRSVTPSFIVISKGAVAQLPTHTSCGGTAADAPLAAHRRYANAKLSFFIEHASGSKDAPIAICRQFADCRSPAN